MEVDDNEYEDAPTNIIPSNMEAAGREGGVDSTTSPISWML